MGDIFRSIRLYFKGLSRKKIVLKLNKCIVLRLLGRLSSKYNSNNWLKATPNKKQSNKGNNKWG